MDVKMSVEPYVALARASVEAYTQDGKIIDPPSELPCDLTQRSAGVFVSLHKQGQLRGCIGTVSAQRSCVAEEIIYNAIAACSKDPRFPPVENNELTQIVYSVDVLDTPEPVDDVSQLDAKRYGVIVSNGWRRGLLLPNLEGVDTPQDQIAIAKRKASIPEDQSCDIERFEVIRHE